MDAPAEDRHGVALAALADPSRRALLQRLQRDGPCRAGLLGAELALSRSAVSQHLGVLRRAELVRSRRRGREMVYEAVPEELDGLSRWLDRYRSFECERLEEPAGLRLASVEVGVADLDRAVEFWRSLLDFVVVTDLRPHGFARVTVVPPSGSGALALVEPSRAPPGGGRPSGVTFVVGALGPAEARLRAAAAVVDAGPVPWGRRAVRFRDLDANVFSLLELE